jgi:hypothetical protein
MKTIKTISKLTMLFAFVAFANTLMAGGNLKVNILPLTSERAVVAISTIDAANLQISIENENGEKVYYKETDADNKDYRKIFDFSNLERGDYTLSVSTNGLTTEREFSVDNKNIAVGKEKSIIEPYFAFKDGVLKLSYLNFPEERMSLNFYAGNDLVYSKEMGNEFNVVEGFDLSRLEKGAYYVVLSTESESYSYNLDLK